MDMIPVTMMDATGLFAIDEVIAALSARGVVFVEAGRSTERQLWFKSRQLEMDAVGIRRFPNIEAAVRAFKEERTPSL
jgi:hypothetical protein